METVKIEPYRHGQEEAIYRLIKKVYDEFVAIDYVDAGNQFFYDWIKPEKIAARQQNGINILTASKGKGIAGMIEIRDNNTVSLLFVDKSYQGQGIARNLLHTAVSLCLQREPKTTEIFVHASPFSIPVYTRLGFRATGLMQETNGIRYLPMTMPVTAIISDNLPGFVQ
jgi:GNAT superfamily N-acetyltransferase